MDSCIICYESNNLIIPQNCKCKTTFHEICLEKMKKSLKIDCPICRNKIIIYDNSKTRDINYNENRIHPIIYLIQMLTILSLLIFMLLISGLLFLFFKFIINMFYFIIL